MASITVSGLGKEYVRGTSAVADLNLEVAEGEFLTLLGPSGCGKSTTLRMLAGLETPTSGEIRFNGRVVNDLTPAERNIAMVFQNYALYPHMSVRENIEYPLKKRGVDRAERRRRSAAVAQLLQIEPLLDRKPRNLSGGQQQRVALGRALIREPEVFLLDEPLSNLDAKLRSYMRAELIELHRRVRATMVYVTHDQLEAMTMSDRIAIFDGGRLQQVGTPDEVYNHPANRTVAAFIGTPAMNFLDGEIAPEGGAPVVRSGSIAIPIEAGRTGASLGRRVAIGLRAEAIRITEGGVPARIEIVEPTGHEAIVTVSVDGRRLVTRTAPDSGFRVGDSVGLGFDARRLHLFDAATGDTLG